MRQGRPQHDTGRQADRFRDAGAHRSSGLQQVRHAGKNACGSAPIRLMSARIIALHKVSKLPTYYSDVFTKDPFQNRNDLVR